MQAVFDFDAVCFRSSASAQKRSIRCLHLPTDKDYEFSTRTEFYGHYKTKSGGWLSKNSSFRLEDFEITDIVEPEPVEHALKAVKTTIQKVKEVLGCDNYYGYIGGGTNFRDNICTLWKYKGSREGVPRPVHLEACRQYVVRYHNAMITEGAESDDYINRDMHKSLKDANLVGVIAEKDYRGCDGYWYNYVNQEYFEVKGFGKLTRNTKGVTGVGRLFKYWQVSSSDSADTYAAHCFSDFENGDITAYNVLKDCKNDTEAFLAMKKHFQRLYPEPKVITNWKGDTFEIDWFYVMNEMFQLAHLQRWKDDKIDLRKAFKGLGIGI